VPSGIIFINRNGLRWCDAPKEYGPPKTLYNRWKRWGDKGLFARMMEGLASEAAVPKTVMTDVSGHAPLVRACPRKYLRAHRTATSLRSNEKRRNRIKIMFGRLKDWRRVATRYDRCPNLPLRRRTRRNRHVLAMKRERVLTLDILPVRNATVGISYKRR
jgi:transposase